MTIVLPITSRANTDANLFSDVYSNDTAIVNEVNGNLTNSNLAAAGVANIAPGKLAAGSTGQLLVCNASGVPVYATTSGDVTIAAGGAMTIGASKVGTTNVADGAVTSRKAALTNGSVSDNALNQTISSGTPADLTGITLSITPNVASKLLVWASFQFHIGDTHSINQQLLGYLAVDGSRQGTTAKLGGTFALNGTTSSGVIEGNASCSWTVSLTAASHTVKLQSALDQTPGTETATCKQATMSYLLLSQ